MHIKFIYPKNMTIYIYIYIYIVNILLINNNNNIQYAALCTIIFDLDNFITKIKMKLNWKELIFN